MVTRLKVAANYLLVLAPIVFIPATWDRWVWGSILTMLAGSMLMLFALTHARQSGVGIPVLLAAGITLFYTIRALAAHSPLQQLLGAQSRYDGLLLWVTCVAALWAGAGILSRAPADRNNSTSFSPEVALWSAGNIAASAVGIMALISLLEVQQIYLIDTMSIRGGSLAGNATDQAFLCLLYAGLISASLLPYPGSSTPGWEHQNLAQQPPKLRFAFRASTVVRVIGLLFAIIGIASSGSRAGIGTMFLAGIVIAYVLIAAHYSRKRAILMTALFPIVGLMLLLATPGARSRLFSPSELAVQTVSDRPVMWSAAWHMIRDHLWFGVGPNGFSVHINTYLPKDWYQRADADSILDDPHNVLLRVLSDVGVLGALLVGCVVAWIFVRIIRNLRLAEASRRSVGIILLSVIGAVFVGLLVSPLSPKVALILALFLGMLLSPEQYSNHRSPNLGNESGRRKPRQIRDRLQDAVPPALMRGIGAAVLALTMLAVGGNIAAARSFYVGMLSMHLGDVTSGVTAFEKAMKLRPWDEEFAVRAAERMLQGHTEAGAQGASDAVRAELSDRGFEYAKRAVELAPLSARSHQIVGIFARLHHDPALALEHLQRSIELDPVNPLKRYSLSHAYVEFGDTRRAADELLAIMELVEPESRQELEEAAAKLVQGER